MKSFRGIDFHLFDESVIKTIELKDLYTAVQLYEVFQSGIKFKVA